MRLIVIDESGNLETIELQEGEWIIVKGSHLNRMKSSDGAEHFFTHDGFYDGWGASIPESDSHTAKEILHSIEAQRKRWD